MKIHFTILTLVSLALSMISPPSVFTELMDEYPNCDVNGKQWWVFFKRLPSL